MGKEIQPMSQERIQGGGKQGDTSVTCSPDSWGFHSVIGRLTPPLLRWTFSGCPKRPFKIPIPDSFTLFILIVCLLRVPPFFNVAQIVGVVILGQIGPIRC